MRKSGLLQLNREQLEMCHVNHAVIKMILLLHFYTSVVDKRAGFGCKHMALTAEDSGHWLLEEVIMEVDYSMCASVMTLLRFTNN